MIVAVGVIACVIVAALVIGNDAVAVIDAVNEHATCSSGSRYRWHAAFPEARRLPALDRIPRGGQPPDKAKPYTVARGSAMECVSHLEVMKLDELIEIDLYEHGIELLERIVAMLTKLVDP